MENRVIKTKDDFIFADVTDICKSHVRRVELWSLFDLYEVDTDNDTEHLLETMDEIRNVLNNEGIIGIEVGQLK